MGCLIGKDQIGEVRKKGFKEGKRAILRSDEFIPPHLYTNQKYAVEAWTNEWIDRFSRYNLGMENCLFRLLFSP
jgi:hypothetical protein